MTERKSSAASRLDALPDQDAFLPHQQTFLAAHAEGQWCVAAIDEANFKRYQEWSEQQKDHNDTPLPKKLAPMLDQSGVSTATACKVLRELLLALEK